MTAPEGKNPPVRKAKAARPTHARAVGWVCLAVAGGALAWGGVRLYRRAQAPPSPEVDFQRRAAVLQKGVSAAPRDLEPRLRLIAFLLERRRAYDALDAAREAHAAFPN